MKKIDFKALFEVAQAVPVLIKLDNETFESSICAFMDVYAHEHKLGRFEMLAGVAARFLTGDENEIVKLLGDEESDDDQN